MKKFIILLMFLYGCSELQSQPTKIASQSVGVDPTISWQAPTTNCDGTLLTSALSYNVYAAASPAVIPTIANTTVPCTTLMLVDRTKISPLNLSPISALTYQANLSNGSWQIGIEAIDQYGNQGGVVTTNVIVTNRPGLGSGIIVK